MVVPVTVISLGLFMVHKHAEPVDDCPCFEDAIAFIAVIMGVSIGRWHEETYSLSASSGFFKSRTPGWDSPLSLTSLGFYTWFSFASLKMMVGVLIIFGWRIMAKWVMHTVLPPLFRTLATLVSLPHRRFYTPATDYQGSVPEGEDGRARLLYPIPSVVDIPGMMHGHRVGNGNSSGVEVIATGANLLPRYSETGARRGGGLATESSRFRGDEEESEKRVMVHEEKEDEEKLVKKHYDADGEFSLELRRSRRLCSPSGLFPFHS